MHSPPPRDAADDEVEQTVLAYLRNHPQAADTLRGIVSWWLQSQRYETASARIERTLEELVTAGTLRRQRLHGGAVLYALSIAPRPPGVRPTGHTSRTHEHVPGGHKDGRTNP